jgi:hypothetical protein
MTTPNPVDDNEATGLREFLLLHPDGAPTLEEIWEAAWSKGYDAGYLNGRYDEEWG